MSALPRPAALPVLWRRQEPRHHHARRRHGSGGRRTDRRRLRFGRRALHGGLGCRARRKTTADRLMEKLIPRVESLKIGTSIDRRPITVAGTREAVEKVKGYIDIAFKEGATLASTAAASRCRATRRVFYLGGSLFRQRHQGHADLQGRDLWPGVSRSCAAHDYKEALALPSEHDYGNGVAIFTRDGDARATSRPRSCRHGRHSTCRSRCRSLTTPSAAGRSRASRSQPDGPDSVRSTPRPRRVTSRWPSGVKEGAEFSIPLMK